MSITTVLNNATQIEIKSSKPMQMMLAFRPDNSDLDTTNFFSNLCIRNFEIFTNSAETLQLLNFFDSKHREHNLFGLALSLYCDIPLSAVESGKVEYLLDEYPSLRLILDLTHIQQPISLYALLQVNAFKFPMQKGFECYP